jgi:hypothetical protein
MRWLKNLFSTHREFTGDFITSADALESLVASNEIVRAEYELFEKKVQTSTENLTSLAKQSADALSGYGIAVKPQAFIEAVDAHQRG